MTLTSCIEMIAQSVSCTLKAPMGMPTSTNGLPLPSDVRQFYELAGGAVLFADALYPIEIVTSQDVVRANPLIVGSPCEYDISFDWFIIVICPPEYVTIDLNPGGLGRCYDSFWDRHGLCGECPIIAISFTELLEHLVLAEGKNLYWIEDDFKTLGD